jgi:hypothetical protein
MEMVFDSWSLAKPSNGNLEYHFIKEYWKTFSKGFLQNLSLVTRFSTLLLLKVFEWYHNGMPHYHWVRFLNGISKVGCNTVMLGSLCYHMIL